jgi:hypothetical protein
MPSCSYQHLGLLNIFVVMNNCLPSCPISPTTKHSCGATQLGHVDTPQAFSGGTHDLKGCPDVNVIVQVMTISGALIHSPHLLVRATGERFLPARGTFTASLASESHWLQPMLILSVTLHSLVTHTSKSPVSVGGLSYRLDGDMAMTHHESHLQKMHFQFGVIMA